MKIIKKIWNIFKEFAPFALFGMSLYSLWIDKNYNAAIFSLELAIFTLLINKV